MSAGRHDIVIEEGATFTLSATWEISGAAVNLSGYPRRAPTPIRAPYADQ